MARVLALFCRLGNTCLSHCKHLTKKGLHLRPTVNVPSRSFDAEHFRIVSVQRKMKRVKAVLCVLTVIASVRAQTNAKLPVGAGNARAAKTAPPIVEDWQVWGGKNRDFIVNTS